MDGETLVSRLNSHVSSVEEGCIRSIISIDTLQAKKIVQLIIHAVMMLSSSIMLHENVLHGNTKGLHSKKCSPF
jgi:hypothetical protein